MQRMVNVTNRPGDACMLQFDEGVLWIDETDPQSPFMSTQELPIPLPIARPRPTPGPQRPRRGYPQRQRTEEEIADSLFGEDEDLEAGGLGTREVVTRIRQRNIRAVQALKELYGYRCQITGTTYIFRKHDGNYYTEAHHLIPLGEGGADNPRNIIIISPLIHCMLHFAEVSEIDLRRIVELPDGSATLEILINGEPYIITWHPRHAARVLRPQNSEARE